MILEGNRAGSERLALDHLHVEYNYTLVGYLDHSEDLRTRSTPGTLDYYPTHKLPHTVVVH